MPEYNAGLVRQQQDQLVGIIQSPGFQSLLTRLAQDPHAREQAVANPRQFVHEQQQLQLPADARVTMRAAGGWSICVGIGVLQVCYQF